MNFKSILFGMALAVSPVFGFADSNIKMVVGTYTDAGSQGLYSFSFDQSTGKASGITSLKVDNPSYFTFSKDGRNIYAVSEKNNATAVLNCIGYDPVKGTFAFKNSQLTHGGDPCYVDTDGKIALTANYSAGTISVFPILKNGTLDKSLLQLGSVKGGPDRSRQNTPHAHCAIFAPDGYILTTDFSGDRILCFSYNKRDKKIDDHTFIFSGRMEIDDINEKFGLTLPEDEDFMTIAGYILCHHPSIPSQGQILEIGDLRFEILRSTSTKIVLVKMTLPPGDRPPPPPPPPPGGDPPPPPPKVWGGGGGEGFYY